MTADEMMQLLRDALLSDSRSQRQLAEDADIGMAQLHHFKYDTRSLSLQSGLKLASALGMELRRKRPTGRQAKKHFYGTVSEFLEHQKERGIVPRLGNPLVVRIGNTLNAICGVDEENMKVIGEYWSVADSEWKLSRALHPNGTYPFAPLSDGAYPKFKPAPEWISYIAE